MQPAPARPDDLPCTSQPLQAVEPSEGMRLLEAAMAVLRAEALTGLGSRQLEEGHALLAVTAASVVGEQARTLAELDARGELAHARPGSWAAEQAERLGTPALGSWEKTRLNSRTDAVRLLPRLATALADGLVSPDVVDRAVTGARRLPPEVVTQLDDWLVALGSAATPEAVADVLQVLRSALGDEPEPHPETDSLSVRSSSGLGTTITRLSGTFYGLSGEQVAGVLKALVAARSTDHHQAVTAELDAFQAAEQAAREAAQRDDAGTGDGTGARDAVWHGSTAEPYAQQLAHALVALCRAAAQAPGTPGAVPGLAGIATAPHGLTAHPVVLITPAALDETGPGARPAPGTPAPRTGDGHTLPLGEARAAVWHARVRGTLDLLLITQPSSQPGAVDPDGPDAWQLLRPALAGLVGAPVAPHPSVLAHGRTQRLATPAQWVALLARDQRCVVRGCHAPASQCEAHHRAEWHADRGPTDLDNLALLCRRHHAHLHEADLQLVWTGTGPVGAVIPGDPTERWALRPRHHPPGDPPRLYNTDALGRAF